MRPKYIRVSRTSGPSLAQCPHVFWWMRKSSLDHKQCVNHLGTLGTGNHFIEVCLDENENVWFLLHSGSRGVGNRFGTFFIELAKNDMRQWMINLADKDLNDKVLAPNVKSYLINVASYKNGVGYGKWVHIDGWSEAVIEYIRALEQTAWIN
jgi:hypothetical protein